MELQDLRIFARVARMQNLTAVGVEFDLSAGTISKRLQGLEAELSVRLFDRTTRSISITEEGEQLLTEIERILPQLDAAFANVAAHVEQPRGRLRILAPTSIGRGVIGPAMCVFMQAYEEIELQLDLTDRVVGVADSGYDVAIRLGELEDSSLVAKRLAADPQVIVAAPKYLARRVRLRTPEDLAQHSCLMFGEGQHWRFEQNGVSADVKVSGRLRSDNAELLRHAAIEGFGVLRTSRFLVADELRSGLLVPVLENYAAESRSAVWAVYPSSRHVLPKLRVFLEFMATWMRDDGEVRAAPAGANGNGAQKSGEAGVRPDVRDLIERIAKRQSAGRMS